MEELLTPAGDSTSLMNNLFEQSDTKEKEQQQPSGQVTKAQPEKVESEREKAQWQQLPREEVSEDPLSTTINQKSL